MEVFLWQFRYKTGIASVDGQHMALFAWCNALSASRDSTSVLEILRQMRDYADLHFRDEEAHMAALHYPGLGWHRAEHDSLSSGL